MFGPVSEGMRMFRDKSSIAVVGYSERSNRIVGKITAYLLEEGNRLTGVNPNLEMLQGTRIPVVRALSELPLPVDVIQIFRNSSALPELAREILALTWKPKLVWCQQGVVDMLFQERLEKAGIAVVMDACPYALRSYL